MADVERGKEVVVSRTVGGRLAALLGLCQPLPHLLFRLAPETLMFLLRMENAQMVVYSLAS